MRRPKDEHLIGQENEIPYPPCFYIVETGTNLVFFGRLTPIKGLRVLLEAVATTYTDRPDLTVVGDGDDQTHLEQLPAHMSDAARFLGCQSQQCVADALAEADGKPVICTQLAGVGELIKSGVSSFIIPEGDVESLTVRIHEMAEDPEQHRQMGEAGRKKVCAEFDIRPGTARIGTLFIDTHDGEIRPEPFKAAS